MPSRNCINPHATVRALGWQRLRVALKSGHLGNCPSSGIQDVEGCPHIFGQTKVAGGGVAAGELEGKPQICQMPCQTLVAPATICTCGNSDQVVPPR